MDVTNVRLLLSVSRKSGLAPIRRRTEAYRKMIRRIR